MKFWAGGGAALISGVFAVMIVLMNRESAVTAKLPEPKQESPKPAPEMPARVRTIFIPIPVKTGEPFRAKVTVHSGIPHIDGSPKTIAEAITFVEQRASSMNGCEISIILDDQSDINWSVGRELSDRIKNADVSSYTVSLHDKRGLIIP